MKNFWNEQTVNRNADRAGFANSHEYIRAKEKEFERDSGVKWSAEHTAGGYRFDPVDEGIPVASSVADDDLASIRYVYEQMDKGGTGYVSYLRVSEDSGISLRRLMPIVRWMEKQGTARRTINRMGKAYAFKLIGSM